MHRWIELTQNYSEIVHQTGRSIFRVFILTNLLATHHYLALRALRIAVYAGGHVNVGMSSPTDHPFVKLAFEGAKRSIGKQTKNRKEPMSLGINKAII